MAWLYPRTGPRCPLIATRLHRKALSWKLWMRFRVRSVRKIDAEKVVRLLTAMEKRLLVKPGQSALRLKSYHSAPFRKGSWRRISTAFANSTNDGSMKTQRFRGSVVYRESENL